MKDLGLHTAVSGLGALAHDARLAVFRLLVRAGEKGVSAGEIAREIGVRASTLSTQLAILSNAGLIRSRRVGRSIIYSPEYEAIRDLLRFLVADCCGGRPEICVPLNDLVQNCRPSK